MNQLAYEYNRCRHMRYFCCPFCGSDNIYEFSPLRVCNNCQASWPKRELPDFLPGQIVVRTMIGAPGLHRGVYLGCGEVVFHSTPEFGAHFGHFSEFAQGKPVWADSEAANSAEDVLTMWDRARMKEGTPWSAGENCEDIAFYVRNGLSNSPTRSFVMTAAVCATLFVAFR